MSPNRNIPNLNKGLVFPILGNGPKLEKTFISKLEKFERNCEKSFIETLSRLSIQASVKTDPYSLPYKKEVKYVLPGESYLNGAYEFHRVARVFVKELLNENVYKMRFYIFVEIDTDWGFMGKVTYHLRYYEH